MRPELVERLSALGYTVESGVWVSVMRSDDKVQAHRCFADTAAAERSIELWIDEREDEQRHIAEVRRQEAAPCP